MAIFITHRIVHRSIVRTASSNIQSNCRTLNWQESPEERQTSMEQQFDFQRANMGSVMHNPRSKPIIVIRLKRKRTEPSLEELAIISDVRSIKREKITIQDVGDALAKLNTSPGVAKEKAVCGLNNVSRLIFRKVDAALLKGPSLNNITQPHKLDFPRKLEIVEAFKKVNATPLQGENQSNKMPDTTSPISRHDKGSGARVFSPFERAMDQAILTAWHQNDFSHSFELIGGVPVDFKSSSIEGKTLLMAAARHNRIDVITNLLSRGANPNIVDNVGISAAQIALENGHHDSFRILAQIHQQCHAAADEVYDFYSFSRIDDQMSTEASASGPTIGSVESVELAADVNIDNYILGNVEELEEDWFLAAEDKTHAYDDVDSNDEDYEFNDYPDESSSDDEVEDDY